MSILISMQRAKKSMFPFDFPDKFLVNCFNIPKVITFKYANKIFP